MRTKPSKGCACVRARGRRQLGPASRDRAPRPGRPCSRPGARHGTARETYRQSGSGQRPTPWPKSSPHSVPKRRTRCGSLGLPAVRRRIGLEKRLPTLRHDETPGCRCAPSHGRDRCRRSARGTRSSAGGQSLRRRPGQRPRPRRERSHLELHRSSVGLRGRALSGYRGQLLLRRFRVGGKIEGAL